MTGMNYSKMTDSVRAGQGLKVSALERFPSQKKNQFKCND